MSSRGNSSPSVKAGEVYHILHQLYQPRGLAPDAAEEALAVLGLDQPALQQLRGAHDGVQRGLELVGHVGGELAAQALGAQLFRHIDREEHGTVPALLGGDRAGREHVLALAAAYVGLRPLAAGAFLQQRSQLRAAVYGEYVAALAGGVHAEDLPRAGVDAHDHARAVEQDEALAHVPGDGRELLLAAGELVQLVAYLPLLPLQAGQQGAQLVVDLVVKRLVEVNGVERGRQCAWRRREASQPEEYQGPEQVSAPAAV